MQRLIRHIQTLGAAAIALSFIVLSLAVAGPALAKNPFSSQPGVSAEPLKLEARLTDDGAPITTGITWRIFRTAARNGKLDLVATADGGSATLSIPPGEYYINCAFGHATVTRKVVIPDGGMKDTQTLVLNAGGLVLNAVLGEAVPAKASLLSFKIYQNSNGKRNLIIDAIKPETIIRLPEGDYEVVSNYGDLNAQTSAKLHVDAGKLTEATLKQQAAEVSLRLATTHNGEALADTAWTVLGASGDVLTESNSAYPSLVLAEGSYTAVARNKQDVFEKNFTVSSGQNAIVELLTTDDKADINNDDLSGETVD
ncbi:hypothetical protein [Martelella sp. HB161492]|uniref:hypothetical protein n=1 Tax=Martelella sp. HB161492 TaxID=2720726 RepID=UPI0015903021|nr:hypothetical protein [Martelella sp. HB161492]